MFIFSLSVTLGQSPQVHPTTKVTGVLANCIKRNERKALEESSVESDGIFAFIAGYTSGGVPYGAAWEEMEGAPDGSDPAEEEVDDKIPF